LWVLVIALAISIPVVCVIGAVPLSVAEVFAVLSNKLGLTNYTLSTQQAAIVWDIRLPRVLMSVAVGAALASSGVVLQGLLRNPLADPGLLGISTGAAFTAALYFVFFGTLFTIGSTLSDAVLPIFSFIGSTIVCLATFAMARGAKQTHVANLLLAGIAINALCGALTGLLTYLANDSQLRNLTFWTLGSFGKSTWTHTLIMMAIATSCVTAFFFLFKPLNVLVLGEKESSLTGVPVEKLKRRIILLTSLSVGVSVAFCGVISFVGLVVPHIMRLAGNSDHRFLIPASALGGALLLCWSDTLARTIAAPAEVPVGIITSLIGAPTFIYMILREKKTRAYA
jgi:iron complex transport system permease protein